jgi:FlaA1/EpsC-like NDP-sugar epimerase
LPSYWSIMLLTTIVWAIAAEESGLWSAEQLYAPGKKSRRLLEALAFTYAIVMAVGFLYRQQSYSRLVVGISAFALFVLATIARIASRVALEMLRKSGKNEVRILIVGTDRFARRVATSLTHGEVLPCKVAGFVRLPDQEIAVEGPIYEVDKLPAVSNGHSIDDVIIALPAGRLSDVQKVAPALVCPHEL